MSLGRQWAMLVADDRISLRYMLGRNGGSGGSHPIMVVGSFRKDPLPQSSAEVRPIGGPGQLRRAALVWKRAAPGPSSLRARLGPKATRVKRMRFLPEMAWNPDALISLSRYRWRLGVAWPGRNSCSMPWRYHCTCDRPRALGKVLDRPFSDCAQSSPRVASDSAGPLGRRTRQARPRCGYLLTQPVRCFKLQPQRRSRLQPPRRTS
jgi:hypothetical protein